MIYLIIGHRGVGKTLWLKKLERLFLKSKLKGEKLYFLDLDEEIEKKTKKKINLLLSGKGKLNEKNFRLIEKKTLNELIQKYKSKNNFVFIAIGAGFKWDKKKLPSFCHVIHLIRETDSQGRIFLNRPRLKTRKTPYEEYKFLYAQREKNYKKIREESFVLPEQDFLFHLTEKLFFGVKKQKLNSIFTLDKASLPADRKKWMDFINKRLSWGVRFFELRDDHLKKEELNFLLKILPKENQLLGFRKSGKSVFSEYDLSGSWDWPLEKGTPLSVPPILSLHTRKKGETFSQVCKKLMRYKAGHFKLAVSVKNFKELLQGHLWFLKDPKNRSFLPVSPGAEKGKWRWYRQIFGPRMKLHFIREALSEYIDQPFLYEHLISTSVKDKGKPCFAAVLGHPVIHSASPAFHRTFFSKYEMVFTKIPMTERECTRENLLILRKMGLVFSAVTSPLKKKAYQICDVKDPYARSVKAVNTLVFKNDKIFGSNTDGYGLQALLEKVKIDKKKKNIIVWGGGGMKQVLKEKLPFAYFYSARTGKSLRPCSGKVDIVVWAVGRSRMPCCVFPPSSWKPSLIVDLNYTEDSPGLEYALLSGVEYVSGKKMFEHQAKKQQDFLSKIF